MLVGHGKCVCLWGVGVGGGACRMHLHGSAPDTGGVL